MTAWDTRSCGFSLLQNCFQAMVFPTARWEGKEGLKENTEWKESIFSFYQQTFLPWCAFHSFGCSAGTGDPIHWWESTSVHTAIPKGSQRTWPCLLEVQSSSRQKLPLSVGGSGHWMLLSMALLCFLFLSPALTCTCQRYIQIHPAFGSGLHTLWPPFVLQLR